MERSTSVPYKPNRQTVNDIKTICNRITEYSLRDPSKVFYQTLLILIRFNKKKVCAAFTALYK